MKKDDSVLLWKEQYEKTEQSLILNERLLKETLSQRAESQLKALMKSKAKGIAAGILYPVLPGIMLYYFTLFSCGQLFYRPVTNFIESSLSIMWQS